MPRCPVCDVNLTEAEWNGGTCPTCASAVGGPFPATSPDPGLAILPKDRPGWGSVRVGLGLVIAGIVLLCGFGFAMLLAETSNEASQPSAATVSVMSMATMGLGFAAVTALIGIVLCSGVPGNTGCRRWIWGCMGCLIASLSCVIAAISMDAHDRVIEFRYVRGEFRNSSRPPFDRRSRDSAMRRTMWGPPLIRIIEKLGTTMGLIGNLVFVAFLLAVADFQQQDRLKAGLALFLFVAFVLNLFLAIAVWRQATANPIVAVRVGTPAIGGYGVLIALGMIGLLTWHVAMLLSLRSNITKLLRDELLKT
jgi:hypothetical protein